MRAGSAIAAVLLLGLASTDAEAAFLFFGKKKVARVEVVAVPPPPVPVPRPIPPPEGRDSCVDLRQVKGAQVYGDHAVEVTLRGGGRWRMYFGQQCPTLSFYDGFYYRVAVQGRLCAGRDAVIVRSGGECAIASIMPVKLTPTPTKPPVKRRIKPKKRQRR